MEKNKVESRVNETRSQIPITKEKCQQALGEK